MSKHTPGPWTLTKYGAVVRKDNGCEIVVYTNNGESSINGEANARLIAAAPDLVEALKECITDDSACCMNTGQRERRLKAIDAIARAALNKLESDE